MIWETKAIGSADDGGWRRRGHRHAAAALVSSVAVSTSNKASSRAALTRRQNLALRVDWNVDGPGFVPVVVHAPGCHGDVKEKRLGGGGF